MQQTTTDGSGSLPEENTATWWTPTGFIGGPAPAAYAATRVPGEWRENLEEGGYVMIEDYTEDLLPERGLILHFHPDGHYLVNFDSRNSSGDSRCLIEFFVDADDQGAFFSAWYTKAEQVIAQADEAGRAFYEN